MLSKKDRIIRTARKMLIVSEDVKFKWKVASLLYVSFRILI
jgi:hypothetical protein